MSPIVTMQAQFRELGRIRMGEKKVAGNGKSHPAKLATFRLTSDQRDLLERAAELYQGTVEPWNDPAAGERWQLTTKVDALDILVPPGQTLSQWMEMWSGGGCVRRCDGEREIIGDRPCLCPSDPSERAELAADGKACKPTTRLNVMLPALPDLGVWRLESHGYYAAVELGGTAQFLVLATARGMVIPARLRLDQRTSKRPGQPTRQYAVPVIEMPATTARDLLGTGNGNPAIEERPAAPLLTAGGRQAMPDDQPDLPEDPRFTSARPVIDEIEAAIEEKAAANETCDWRLLQGRTITHCGQPAGHSTTGDGHDFEALALSKGGRVLHPGEQP